MLFFVTGFLLLVSGLTFGQTEPPQTETISDIFGYAVALFHDWKGLSSQARIASVLFLIVGTVKNSALAPYWDKVAKEYKPWIAPILCLVASLVMVKPFTLETFLAAIATGYAAGAAANLLDLVKKLPGIGKVVVSIIDIVGAVLKRPTK